MRKFLSVIIVSLVALATFGQKQLTLDDFVRNYTFRQNSVYGIVSMNDGVHYTTLENNSIVKYSYETGMPVETILDISKAPDNYSKIRIASYSMSENETKILLATNVEYIYRRSFTADYYIYDIAKDSYSKLSDNGKQQLATFSPNGDKVAFVRENNLFIKDLNANKETQITFDGKFNYIINGAPDWVYEEEFGFNKGFQWSTDGNKLAFMRFDESNVRMFNMTMYQGQKPSYDNNKLYPENHTFKYPKAGEDNSLVTIKVYDINTGKITDMNVGPETDQYIPRIFWTKKANTLAILRVNRLQNKMEILYADADSGNSEVVYTEENKYYIDESNYDNIKFIDDKQFLLTSERDGYMHIYLYNIYTHEYKQITKGEWDVRSFDGFDPSTKTVFYTASDVTPIQTNLYSVRLDGKKLTKLNSRDGTNSAVYSTGYKYFINYFSNSTTPNYVTLCNRSGKLIRILEDNKEYIEQISEYNYTTKEFFTFTTPNGDVLNGYMLKPVNFNENKKYPVVMTQYSGPNSQSVVDSWSFNWHNYLSQEGFLTVCIDPRGTAARGEEFRKCTYLQIGKYETEDQISAAKYLQTLPYVDGDNISIIGWSYGGFMVSLCMTKTDVFKAGVAVAPVTNWRYYDNIYTERYMRTPQENPNGYDDNSPISHAEELSGRLLLIHGTADDNVHFQNSIEFSERLVQANKQFDFMCYNNRNHGIYGGNTSRHLYTKVVDFLKFNLMK